MLSVTRMLQSLLVKANKQSGFSLIELLVVISIIGLLAAVVLISLSAARAKARDAQRISNKKQMVTALNLYYSTNNAWPGSVSGSWTCLAPSAVTCWNGGIAGSDSLVTAMQQYVSFPFNQANLGTYAYNSMLYASNIAADGVTSGSPAGAYLVWVQELSMPDSLCPSSRLPAPYFDQYYYCYEYLGK